MTEEQRKAYAQIIFDRAVETVKSLGCDVIVSYDGGCGIGIHDEGYSVCIATEGPETNEWDDAGNYKRVKPPPIKPDLEKAVTDCGAVINAATECWYKIKETP